MQKYLIVAATLAFISPVPWQTPQAAAQTSRNSQHPGAHNGHPTAPSAPVNSPIQPGSADPHSGQAGADNKDQKVAVVSIPTVSVSQPDKRLSDRILEWGPWVFNLLLVAVGAVQAWLLFKTWGKVGQQEARMGEQVVEMRKQETHMGNQLTQMKSQTDILRGSVETAKTSAQAALDQIHAMKQKDRAKLTFKLEPFSPFGYFKSMPFGQTVSWKIDLHGQSEAYEIKAPAILCIGEPEKHQFFGIQTLQIPEVLSPVKQREYGGQVYLHFQEASGTNLGDGEEILGRLKREESTLFFACSIEYTDVYGDQWILKVRKRWVFLKPLSAALGHLPNSPEGFWLNDGENGEKRKQPQNPN